MNVNEVIKYPVLTEKSYAQMQQGIYTFACDKRTNKAEIKKVVEFIFDVKVERVNVININKKPKKLGRFAGFVSGYKKAIVTLKDGEQIQIFPEDEMASAPVEEKPKKEAKAKSEPSEAEKKAAEKIAAKAKEAEEKAAAKIAAKAKEAVADKPVEAKEETKEEAKTEGASQE